MGKKAINDYMSPKGSVLDVGCGCGREAFVLHNLGYKVTAIDLSIQQINQAKQNALNNNKHIDFSVCDGLHYAFANESFDYVIMWQQVLGNVPRYSNRIDVLKEARRVLKPGGHLIVSVHNYEACFPVVERENLLISEGSEERDYILKEAHNSSCYWHYFT